MKIDDFNLTLYNEFCLTFLHCFLTVSTLGGGGGLEITEQTYWAQYESVLCAVHLNLDILSSPISCFCLYQGHPVQSNM